MVKVGRIAGQFAKPRTSPTEKRGGVELPIYRGDIINGAEFTTEARRPIRAGRSWPIGSRRRPSTCCAPSPGRLCQPRECAQWMLVLRQGLPANEALPGNLRPHHRGARLHARLRHQCRYCTELRTTDFFTSHEALLLGYEQAFTRVDSTTGDWYCTSGHMLWIGDRTRQPDHAHVEFAAASRIRSASRPARR